MRKALLLTLLSLLLLVALGAGAAAWWAGRWLDTPMPLKAATGGVAEVSVEAGDTPRAIAQKWVDAGVDVPAWALYEWFRWSGEARRIRAGSYEIDAKATPRSLLERMVRGEESLATVRLIEGWTLKQFRAELARADSLRPTTARMSEAELMVAIGRPGERGEGRFFPDTYAYSKGSADVDVLKRAHRAMQQRLEAAWAQRQSDTPLRNIDEALTLASIVEKETGAAADRGKVAGVFANRLRIGMLLQTDPTVIYGLGDAFDGNLRKRDLQTDTPYNTYTRGGLPPTPIAMPGQASLMAAVRPDATRALYFVARGDGSSEFSENLADHNRAVNKYQRGGRP
jgi:UPF0755 protein